MSTCANACVRVFVHMHLYLFYPFVRVCKSVCMYVATCTCIYASIRKSTHLRMYTCIYACERECTDVYVYLRMCTCIYACVRVSTHVYVYLFSSIRGALCCACYLFQGGSVGIFWIFQGGAGDQTFAHLYGQ